MAAITWAIEHTNSPIVDLSISLKIASKYWLTILVWLSSPCQTLCCKMQRCPPFIVWRIFPSYNTVFHTTGTSTTPRILLLEASLNNSDSNNFANNSWRQWLFNVSHSNFKRGLRPATYAHPGDREKIAADQSKRRLLKRNYITQDYWKVGVSAINYDK